jgi:cytosine/adenosine deaminase-related metal-dependent hydrolase
MQRGLVGPHINIVHGNNLTDDQLKAFVDLGVSFSITPENEMAQGHGHPITGRLRALGSGPSVGVDLESAISGDMFAWRAWRSASQRAPRQRRGSAPKDGGIPATSTFRGARPSTGSHCAARDARHGRPIGSLAPGKQADIA